METYIIFTRLSPSSFKDGEQFRQLAKRVSQRIKDLLSEERVPLEELDYFSWESSLQERKAER